MDGGTIGLAILKKHLLTILFMLLSAVLTINIAHAQQKQKRSTPVEVTIAEQKMISTTSTVDGRVVVGAGVRVVAPKSGQIVFEPLKIGEMVQKGDVIARMEVTDLTKTLQDLRLKDKQKKRQMENNRLRIDSESRRLAILIKQADLIADRLDRIETLTQNQVTTQTSLGEANIRYFEKQQQIVQVENSISILQQDREVMAIDLETLQIEIEDIQRQISEAEIVAPIDGQIISLADFSIGYSRVGDTLVTLQRDDDYEIEADIPLGWMAYLRDVQTIAYENHLGVMQTARLRVELPQENPRSRTRLVRFEIPDVLDENLRAVGASLALMVPTSIPEDQITVPSDALVPLRGGYIVFVIEDGKAIQRQVITGGILDGRVIIKDGVKAEEQVVIKGNELLSNGQAVQVIGQD
jgi:multidrug efflux pump subunit AcrA (membrane-fusion protein)